MRRTKSSRSTTPTSTWYGERSPVPHVQFHVYLSPAHSLHLLVVCCTLHPSYEPKGGPLAALRRPGPPQVARPTVGGLRAQLPQRRVRRCAPADSCLSSSELNGATGRCKLRVAHATRGELTGARAAQATTAGTPRACPPTLRPLPSVPLAGLLSCVFLLRLQRWLWRIGSPAASQPHNVLLSEDSAGASCS